MFITPFCLVCHIILSYLPYNYHIIYGCLFGFAWKPRKKNITIRQERFFWATKSLVRRYQVKAAITFPEILKVCQIFLIKFWKNYKMKNITKHNLKKKFISQIWQTFKCSETDFANLAWYRRTEDLVPLFDPKVHRFENSLQKIMAQLHSAFFRLADDDGFIERGDFMDFAKRSSTIKVHFCIVYISS